MSVDIDDFINPKSMLTPSGVAAIVATASGAVFSMFRVSLPIMLSLFSLWFAGVVFLSKEFRNGSIGRFARGFYYTLNAIIIFAMATGTHAVLDRGGSRSQARIDLGLVSTAIAQGTNIGMPSIKQQRPGFYDWTSRSLYGSSI